MKKDLVSFEKHNSQYLMEDVNTVASIIKDYEESDRQNKFAFDGFERAINMTNPLPKKHIDMGSGLGWVVRKTSPLFETVYAVEPSKRATELASSALKEKTNITYINEEMVEALGKIDLTTPVFITTSVVLSHIKDEYVSFFLHKLATLPNGSAFFFDERYDKNIQWRLWYIRSTEWWATNLPDWQLSFFDIHNSGYKTGIYGLKVGKENVTNSYRMNIIQKIGWLANGILYTALGLLRKLLGRQRI